MRVSQLNYGAIKNAYAAQFGARQAEIAVDDQRNYKDYAATAYGLSVAKATTDFIFDLAETGVRMWAAIDTEIQQNDAQEASLAWTRASLDIQGYINQHDADDTFMEYNEDGTITFSPEAQKEIDSIIDGYMNPDWHPDIQKQFRAGAGKFIAASASDMIDRDYQNQMAGRDTRFQQRLGDALTVGVANDDGYAAIDSVIDSATWLNEDSREALRYEWHHSQDVGTWNQAIAGYIERGDYTGGREYIKSLVASGKINVGSEEYNTLQNYLASGFATEKARVASEAQNYATEALAGGTSPATVRKTIEAETEARGYSAEFRESAMDGVDIAQASYAYSAIQDDLTSLLNGYSTINDLQTFKNEIKDGKYSYLFEGIEGEADKLIGNIIDPAIKSLQDQMKAIDKSMEDNFKKEADAILAGNYKPSDKVYLISSYAGQNPTLQVLARGYIDKINADLLTDSQQIIYDNWDKLAETRIKDAAGDAWGKEGGMPYMQKLVDFRSNMQKFIQSHADDLTDDMLNDFAVQQLGLLLSSDIDSINEAARLGSGEGTLIEAGARVIAHPIEGDFSYNTNKLGQAIDAVLSPEMRNEMILNPDTGAWESTTDTGENLWNQMLVLEYTLLNEEGILATKTYPMADEEGNVYTYPVSEDKDGNKYIIDKEGLFRQAPDSTEWELIRPFNPAKTSDRQEEQPDILLRHTKSDGNQFWHGGTWYTVSKLDPDSDIGQAYGMYRRTYKGRIPNAEEK